jgi:hypothetical protein
MTIQIDKGIPIPPANPSGRQSGQRRGQRKYPWMAMPIGSSFIYPGDSGGAWRSIIGRHKLTHYRYVSRRLLEDGQWVTRIWRIA